MITVRARPRPSKIRVRSGCRAGGRRARICRARVRISHIGVSGPACGRIVLRLLLGLRVPPVLWRRLLRLPSWRGIRSMPLFFRLRFRSLIVVPQRAFSTPRPQLLTNDEHHEDAAEGIPHGVRATKHREQTNRAQDNAEHHVKSGCPLLPAHTSYLISRRMWCQTRPRRQVFSRAYPKVRNS